MRIVIDSDILVAVYTEKIRNFWQAGKGSHQFFISPEIFTAVERALRQGPEGLPPEAIQNILKDILKRCGLVRPQATETDPATAAKDAPLLTVARVLQPDAILTGNAALQKQKAVEGIPILSPAQFLKSKSV